MSIGISAMAAGLEDGGQNRDVCPFCMGGRSKEASFSIRRVGNVAFWHCFRASCDMSGRYTYKGDQISHSRSQVLALPHKSARYDKPVHPIDESLGRYLFNKFVLVRAQLDLYPLRMTDNQRLVIPIINRKGVIVGEELKNYPYLTGRQITKSVIKMDSTEPVMSWYTRSPEYTVSNTSLGAISYKSDTLLIVEDQISAMKASVFCHCVALLGTGLYKDKMVEIGDVRYRRVILALDSDAFSKAVHTFKIARAIIENLELVRLDKDVKDMTYTDIKKKLKI